jgi:CHAD domain-containing protein
MRAAMALFREALPVRTQRLREELRWIAGALGEVRDLDVQLERFREWERDMPDDDRAALAPLVDRLEDARSDARARLLQQLDSRRYDRLDAGMTDLLRRGPLRRSAASRTPAVVAAPDLLRRRYRAVRKRADSPPGDFHAERIRSKRLRYAIEFLAPLAPKPSKRLVKRLVVVQDCLGEHQDAIVAMAHIEELIDDDLPPRAVFLLGRISERYDRAARELRAAFPDIYAGIRGKPWTDLWSELRGRRDHALATMPAPRLPRLRTAAPPPAARKRPRKAEPPAAGLTVVGD